MSASPVLEHPKLPLWLRLLLPAVIFAAFLTETKFIPSLEHNVGIFELLGGLLVAICFLRPQATRPRWNSALRLLGALLAAAVASQINLAAGHRLFGLLQLAILAFMLLFLLAAYNLALSYRLSPGYILRWTTWAVLIVGPWIVLQARQAEANLDAVGPFRNRAHMGSYMLTAFWLVVVYYFWPNRHRFKALLCTLAMTLTLYAVAVSGRRSVYTSLAVGLIALVASQIVTRRRRLVLAWVAILAVGFLSAFFVYGEELLPRASFFRERVFTVDDRLRAALGVEGEQAEEKSFIALQKEGGRRAFIAHPLLGIGWGGFAESSYSPTGHEMHSTPLRLLAETGLVGFVLYSLWMLYLLVRSSRMFLYLRATPFGPAYQVLTIALWSLSVSYLYNRHITERTCWLLLVVFLLFETVESAYSRRVAASRRLRSRVHAMPARQPAAAGFPATPPAGHLA